MDHATTRETLCDYTRLPTQRQIVLGIELCTKLPNLIVWFHKTDLLPAKSADNKAGKKRHLLQLPAVVLWQRCYTGDINSWEGDKSVNNTSQAIFPIRMRLLDFEDSRYQATFVLDGRRFTVTKMTELRSNLGAEIGSIIKWWGWYPCPTEPERYMRDRLFIESQIQNIETLHQLSAESTESYSKPYWFSVDMTMRLVFMYEISIVVVGLWCGLRWSSNKRRRIWMMIHLASEQCGWS